MSRISDYTYIVGVASTYGISPKTLWGVYGEESDFGANTNNSGSGPAGGAKGYFQFEDATAKQYGVDVTSFQSSARGAAHYLHDLGADGNPTSPATRSALNAYNGNGGGSGETTYTKGVEANGKVNPAGSTGVIGIGQGAVDAAGTAAQIPGAIAGSVSSVTSAVGTLGKIGGALLQPSTYFRLGKGVLGGTLLIIGTGALVFIVANHASGGAVGKAGKDAAVAAAL